MAPKNKILVITIIFIIIISMISCNRYLVDESGKNESPSYVSATGNFSKTNAPLITHSPDIIETNYPAETNLPESTYIETSSKTTKPSNTVSPSGNRSTQTVTNARTASPVVTPVKTAEPTADPVKTPTSTFISNDSIKTAVNLSGKVPADYKNNYNLICTAIEGRKDSVELSLTEQMKIEGKEPADGDFDYIIRLLYYLREYNPQYFYYEWIYLDFSYLYIPYERINKVTIKLNYNSAATDSNIKKLEDKVSEIVAAANKKPNLFERELYVHDYLVKNIKYDKTTDNCANIYGALIEGKAKCEGYARTFQYIMNRLGVETILVTGETYEGHIWNIVKLYGQYYYVDVTYDDPLPDRTIKDGDEYLISHNYFNITTAKISETHKIHAKSSYGSDGFIRNMDLVSCTADTYSYEKIKG